jgi:hypothetical protein
MKRTGGIARANNHAAPTHCESFAAEVNSMMEERPFDPRWEKESDWQRQLLPTSIFALALVDRVVGDVFVSVPADSRPGPEYETDASCARTGLPLGDMAKPSLANAGISSAICLSS